MVCDSTMTTNRESGFNSDLLMAFIKAIFMAVIVSLGAPSLKKNFVVIRWIGFGNKALGRCNYYKMVLCIYT